MGGSSYSFQSRQLRAANLGYQKKSAQEIFSSNLHESMDPKNIRMREARDSEVHPFSFPIIYGLDVTGSMGEIPYNLIQTGLPTLVQQILEGGTAHPAILFLAIGDQYSDVAPLQIGQFESGDTELDMWLTRTWLEGNGGGNGGESYSLAWYVAAMMTATDHWDKRGQKGIVITVGNEPVHPRLEADKLRRILQIEEAATYDITDLLARAQEKYHVFHFHIGIRHDYVIDGWKKLLGENVIVLDNYRDLPGCSANLINGIAQSQRLEEMMSTSRRSAELHLGTPNEDGSIPVQQPINPTESLDSQILL